MVSLHNVSPRSCLVRTTLNKILQPTRGSSKTHGVVNPRARAVQTTTSTPRSARHTQLRSSPSSPLPPPRPPRPPICLPDCFSGRRTKRLPAPYCAMSSSRALSSDICRFSASIVSELCDPDVVSMLDGTFFEWRVWRGGQAGPTQAAETNARRMQTGCNNNNNKKFKETA